MTQAQENKIKKLEKKNAFLDEMNQAMSKNQSTWLDQKIELQETIKKLKEESEKFYKIPEGHQGILLAAGKIERKVGYDDQVYYKIGGTYDRDIMRRIKEIVGTEQDVDLFIIKKEVKNEKTG